MLLLSEPFLNKFLPGKSETLLFGRHSASCSCITKELILNESPYGPVGAESFFKEPFPERTRQSKLIHDALGSKQRSRCTPWRQVGDVSKPTGRKRLSSWPLNVEDDHEDEKDDI